MGRRVTTQTGAHTAMLHDAFTGLCEINEGIKFMITANFDLQNQPLERGVVSQPLALPHSSLHEGGTPHTVPIPPLRSPTPSFLPSSSFSL